MSQSPLVMAMNIIQFPSLYLRPFCEHQLNIAVHLAWLVEQEVRLYVAKSAIIALASSGVASRMRRRFSFMPKVFRPLPQAVRWNEGLGVISFAKRRDRRMRQQ
jgi:hypothetical protein